MSRNPSMLTWMPITSRFRRLSHRLIAYTCRLNGSRPVRRHWLTKSFSSSSVAPGQSVRRISSTCSESYSVTFVIPSPLFCRRWEQRQEPTEVGIVDHCEVLASFPDEPAAHLPIPACAGLPASAALHQIGAVGIVQAAQHHPKPLGATRHPFDGVELGLALVVLDLHARLTILDGDCQHVSPHQGGRPNRHARPSRRPGPRCRGAPCGY